MAEQNLRNHANNIYENSKRYASVPFICTSEMKP